MSEAAFTGRVEEFVTGVLGQWREQAGERSPDPTRLDLGSLTVRSNCQMPSGRIPIWKDGQNWTWQRFAREIDVVLGRDAIVEGSRQLLPIVAIELKTDGWLNSDVIDTKDTVYAALKEQYPCLMTCFMMEANDLRRLADATLLRNGRHFDVVVSKWDADGQAVLANAILRHLDYAVEYWGR